MSDVIVSCPGTLVLNLPPSVIPPFVLDHTDDGNGLPLMDRKEVMVMSSPANLYNGPVDCIIPSGPTSANNNNNNSGNSTNILIPYIEHLILLIL